MRLTIFWILVFPFLIGQPSSSQAQSEDDEQFRIDSLTSLLNQPQPDTLKVVRLLLLSNWKGGSLKSPEVIHEAIKLAAQAKELSKKIHFNKGIYRALHTMGGLYEDGLNDYTTSYQLWKEILEVASKNGLYEEIHESYSSLMNYYFHLGDYANAMKVATEGLTLADEKNDERKVAKYTSIYGFIHLRQGHLKTARSYYEKYLQQAQALNDSIMMAESYEYLGDVYMAEKNLEAALNFRFQSLKTYLAISKTRPNYYRRHRIPYNYASIGQIYNLQGNHSRALEFCRQAIDGTFPTNDYELASYFIIAGHIYTDLGDYFRADSLIRMGLTISTRIRHAENVRDAYLAISNLLLRKKKYDSAFYYRMQYDLLKDSILNERSQRAIETIRVEYEVGKKDQEIKLNQQEAEQQRVITFSIAGAFTATLVILYLSYTRYQLKQRNIFQNELNKKQNELFNTITSIQDKERKRIAQDIHDQAGSMLSAAKLQLSDLDEDIHQLAPGRSEKYKAAMHFLDRAAEELRNVSHNLMPAALSRLGLVAALRSLFETISGHSGLTIHFNAHGFEERLPEPIEVNLYPIMLELINNVVKHANATEVSVQLVRYPHYINIQVEDNGRGFDAQDWMNKTDGMGLQNLTSRVRFLSGSISIDSAPGRGTIVLMDIPI